MSRLGGRPTCAPPCTRREPVTSQLAPAAGLDRTRPQGRGHGPGAGHGRRPEGRQRPPRHRHEPGAGGVPAVPEGDAPQPGRPALARPRPLRAVLRPLVASPSTSSSSSAGWGLELDDIKALRTWGSKTPGPPRVRPHRRRRDHDRPARPGHRQRRRHGHGRPPRARHARPQRRRGRRRRSTTTSTRSAATATSRRASAPRPPPSPASSGSAT